MTAPPTTLDRTVSAMRSLVLSFLPQLVYWIVHEYRVEESDGITFSGTPTDASFSPQLPTQVPYSPALAGSSCIVPVGTLAYVAFANADPSRPVLVRFAATLPTSARIDATGKVIVGPSAAEVDVGRADAIVVRDGDTISITPGNGAGPVAGIVSITTGQGLPVAKSRLKA